MRWILPLLVSLIAATQAVAQSGPVVASPPPGWSVGWGSIGAGVLRSTGTAEGETMIGLSLAATGPVAGVVSRGGVSIHEELLICFSPGPCTRSAASVSEVHVAAGGIWEQAPIRLAATVGPSLAWVRGDDPPKVIAGGVAHAQVLVGSRLVGIGVEAEARRLAGDTYLGWHLVFALRSRK